MSKCNIPKKLFLVRTCYKKNTHTCKFVGLRFYCNKKSFKSCHVHIWCFLNSTYMMALPNHFLVGIVSRFSVLFLSELADGHYIGKTTISLALANHVDNMVTKFKHHMRLNFLNLVSTLCIEKKHSLLQMRHQAGCEPVNNRLVLFVPRSVFCIGTF